MDIFHIRCNLEKENGTVDPRMFGGFRNIWNPRYISVLSIRLPHIPHRGNLGKRPANQEKAGRNRSPLPSVYIDLGYPRQDGISPLETCTVARELAR